MTYGLALIVLGIVILVYNFVPALQKAAEEIDAETIEDAKKNAQSFANGERWRPAGHVIGNKGDATFFALDEGGIVHGFQMLQQHPEMKDGEILLFWVDARRVRFAFQDEPLPGLPDTHLCAYLQVVAVDMHG